MGAEKRHVGSFRRLPTRQNQMRLPKRSGRGLPCNTWPEAKTWAEKQASFRRNERSWELYSGARKLSRRLPASKPAHASAAAVFFSMASSWSRSLSIWRSPIQLKCQMKISNFKKKEKWLLSKPLAIACLFAGSLLSQRSPSAARRSHPS